MLDSCHLSVRLRPDSRDSVANLMARASRDFAENAKNVIVALANRLVRGEKIDCKHTG